VATDGQNDMPILDHAVIPLISPGQRARVSEAWINNEDRGEIQPRINTEETRKQFRK
jgi:hypothetical protein